jgi:hypothetical protein
VPDVAAASEQQRLPVPRCSSVAELWSDLSPEEVQVCACYILDGQLVWE